jgi:hypothetical protein
MVGRTNIKLSGNLSTTENQNVRHSKPVKHETKQAREIAHEKLSGSQKRFCFQAFVWRREAQKHIDTIFKRHIQGCSSLH